MVVVTAREEGSTADHFGQDAANAPDVNGLCVLLECQHYLWSTVPSSGDAGKGGGMSIAERGSHGLSVPLTIQS